MVISMLDGTQYVVAASGMQNLIIPTESDPAWVTILAPPGRSKLSLRTGLTAA
jgi:hypothetical protein